MLLSANGVLLSEILIIYYCWSSYVWFWYSDLFLKIQINITKFLNDFKSKLLKKLLLKTLLKSPIAISYWRLGLWPGPKWAGFGQTGLLKTGFTTNRFPSVWVTSKADLNRVITRANLKKKGWKKSLSRDFSISRGERGWIGQKNLHRV